MIAKDAYYFLLPLLLLACLAYFWAVPLLLFVVLLLAVFVAFFFRDPKRSVPADPLAIVSPADGKIIRLERQASGTKLVIFLSIFDVHINRAPIQGRVVRLEHRPGRFHLAFDDRASVENEQVIWTIRGEHELTFSLIAGLIARRIIPWKKLEEVVQKGDKIGLIRFGSRVDIFFPDRCRLAVSEGQRVRGGSTVLAYWRTSV